ncbi:acyltransferase family protein [Clostridium butyricum]|nr:acyltransferase [Clostridium butyricum]MBZ5745721.1 acyltransferase [Clostridium butyricum]MDB2151770.1 acyltransferase [Clostridium butyricum]MDI9210752.1 acyltransferase [Clostridium butyricum]BBK78204.1 hypothetical protein Cbu04g_32120 [Clostridium butyricum]GEQ26679.1 hypothetical protein CBU03nite_31020 [Clostridium butyricum]
MDSINQNNYKQVSEYNLMKVIAIILVVIGHSTYLKISGVDYSQFFGQTLQVEFGKNVQRIVDIIYIFHMALFFAVSGSVYYIQKNKLNKYKNAKELIINKIKRLMIPYILVGILYVIPIKVISRFYSTNYFANAIFYDMLNGIGHLWFLFTLFWIFILFYFLEKYIYNNNKYIFWVIVLITYFFNDIIYNFMPNGLKSNVQYVIFFCIGYFFEIIREKYNNSKCMVVNTIILSVVVYVLYYAQKNINFKYAQLLILLFVKILLILIVYNISYLLNKYLKISKLKLYEKLYKYNFDIYLFHDPLNYLFLYIASLILIKIQNQNLIQTQVFSFFMIFILRFVINIFICIFIAVVINKFKQYKKLRRKLLCWCGVMFVLCFGMVIYDNYNNIHRTNKIYAPRLGDNFTTINLTDENWTNGVSNTMNILLFENNEVNISILKNAKLVKYNNINKGIQNIKEIDNSWIYLELDNRENIEQFAYPNKIQVLK